MRLVLVRHGESEHGQRGVIAGMAGCTGLTQRGFQQVEALTDRLTTTGELRDCEALLFSPVQRARQTAEMLVRSLPGTSIEEDRDLCELQPGEADGLTWAAYRARYGAFDPLAVPHRPFSPGGESWSDFLGRTRATLDRLAERFDGRTIVAVSHAGFIVASILVVFDIPRPGTGARLDPEYTSLSEWRVTGATWQLTRYNDACHVQSPRCPRRRCHGSVGPDVA